MLKLSNFKVRYFSVDKRERDERLRTEVSIETQDIDSASAQKRLGNHNWLSLIYYLCFAECLLELEARTAKRDVMDLSTRYHCSRASPRLFQNIALGLVQTHYKHVLYITDSEAVLERALSQKS